MSFITKRERVFDEYALFELPSRNEGKIKAYASCTDTRAWSHFCSDKRDHLVDVIRRNNEMCRPKLVPTNVIVDTVMAGKNAEIARLKRKIEEFEKMLAVYEDLELTCDQKCEIAKAHASIKEAYKDLDDLCLDLDLSGFTEGIDSEAFETGKSRGDETAKSKGDEWSYEPERDTKGNQVEGLKCGCDATTHAEIPDPRLKDMKETIIAKDAKLNAMQNTIAVMENDACEPYCIYAHIYTALEKIFAVLCQNKKYKLYLEMMTSGKNTCCIDITGKILFKLKVLEKFSLALVAPCTTEFVNDDDCACYRAEVSTRIDAFALTSSESSKPRLDSKRAQLVADIMDNEEMKELLGRDSISTKNESNDLTIEDYNIDAENLKRLQNLQENYDGLMNCYEGLKHEKDCLQIKVQKFEELEKEYENLKNQLREYNALWNEKEHYKNRSHDLDDLKEQFLVLSEETSNIELQLKAEAEINEVKSETIEELRKENISLEKKLNDSLISFEKEKNSMLCKLKECECKEMCQEQQIKVLTVQIDRLLEQDSGKPSDPQSSISLNDAINSQKEQINNLKELLYGSEEEKQHLQDEYEKKLNLINDLRMEIEDWKSKYDNMLQRTEYLENYNETYKLEIDKLAEDNNMLQNDLAEKKAAVDNLLEVINGKSQEINKLMENIENKNKENSYLYSKIQNLQETFKRKLSSLDAEKSKAMSSLELARQESQELLERVKNYHDEVHKQEDLAYSYQKQNQEFEKLKALLNDVQEDNKKMQIKLSNSENQNSILLQQLERLQEVTTYATNNAKILNEENQHVKHSLELTKKESKILEEKMMEYQDLTWQLEDLRKAHNKLLNEKERLVNELHDRTIDLDNIVQAMRVSEKHSEELLEKLHKSESSESELLKLTEAYKNMLMDKEKLQDELDKQKDEFNNLLKQFQELKLKNEQKSFEFDRLKKELSDLKDAYDALANENRDIQNDLKNKNMEIRHLHNHLDKKIEENKSLDQQVKNLEEGRKSVMSDMDSLKREHSAATSTLDALKKDSNELLNKVKHYKSLETDYEELKKAYDQLMEDKGTLQKELEKQKSVVRETQRENRSLSCQSQNLIMHSEDLEKALINARNELIENSGSSENPYAHILKEIDELKREKLKNQKKIRDLFDKLDNADSEISEYREIVLARNDKIAILENHINDLKAEINQLHNTLDEVVGTGEQISDYSKMKLSNTLQNMEAHHSKATHNMKMDVAKLQKDKMRLEEQLSKTKLEKDESDVDKYKYQIHISQLENDKEIIITDIKELEMSSVGDSLLSPDNCAVEDVLKSLDRVRKILDARTNKSTSLDQTLLKVQSKTDEAIRIVEKEKQKIMNEKEEAIRDRLKIEKELNNLKQQLSKQKKVDSACIKDLELELTNQKLIIDKLNESTQSYIRKIEEELESIQAKYENLIKEYKDLEKRLKDATKESSTYFNLIEQANKSLDEKCKEIEDLRHKLQELKKPNSHDVSTQVPIADVKTFNTVLTQTETYESPKSKIVDNENKAKLMSGSNDEIKLIHINTHKRESVDLPKTEIQPSLRNEVQVLTASIDPNIDYVKNAYTNFKLRQLTTSGMEQYSYACSKEDEDSIKDRIVDDYKSNQSADNNYMNTKPTSSKTRHLNILYDNDKQSLTDSSKALEIEINDTSPKHSKSLRSKFNITKSDNVSDVEKKQESKADNSINTPSESTNKDLFVIYKDTDTKYESKPEGRNWNRGKSEILVEAVTFQSTPHSPKQESKQRYEKGKYTKYELELHEPLMYAESYEIDEDDSVKPKLNINIPRIDVDTHSLDNSETDKKSLGSYTMESKEYYPTNHKRNENKLASNQKLGDRYSTHSLSNEEEQYFDSYNSTDEHAINQNLNKKGTYLFEDRSPATDDSKHIIPSPEKQSSYTNIDDGSNLKLSRVGADMVLIKKDNDNEYESLNKEHRNYGLDYILDSTQQHDDPNNFKTYNAAIKLRKVRSAISEISPKNDKKSSATFYKNVSSISPSKTSGQSGSKSFTERSVLVKLDTVEDYEQKINDLTKTLENIEKDYKKKIDAIKTQYDNNIKSIINEHNQGVKSIQSLHEETLQDILKIHENEVENLRTMSIEAMRKAEKLERENKNLKTKMSVKDGSQVLDEEPTKMSTADLRHKKMRMDTKMLTKTKIEAFNVKPKTKPQGPCTCSVDVNVSDTIRNLFEQVDVEQRKKAEQTYLKYIANKMLSGNVEALDTQELSFLHLKVCRLWKVKQSKEEVLQKRIDTIETELLSKQKHAQHNIAELDRKVAEERRRLQEAREAVCRNTPTTTTNLSKYDFDRGFSSPSPSSTIEREYLYRCNCNPGSVKMEISERRSAGDLAEISNIDLRQKRGRNESNRAVLANLDAEERHVVKKHYTDELPTRLRKTYERQPYRTNKK